MHLICTSIVFNFSWDGCNCQEKWKAKVLQFFFFFFGGGGALLHMCKWRIVKRRFTLCHIERLILVKFLSRLNNTMAHVRYIKILTKVRGFLVIFLYFGLVFFVFNSLLVIATQWSGKKFAILTLKPRSHVRILYRTWAILFLFP